MKKIFLVSTLITLILLSLATITLAVEPKDTLNTDTASELMNVQNEFKSEKDELTEKYGSEAYGVTALILNKIRWYSIPLCFVGIAIGALYQYVLGTRRLDMKQRGFALIVSFITILVICQVLPLIFAIVVRGWGD